MPAALLLVLLFLRLAPLYTLTRRSLRQCGTNRAHPLALLDPSRTSDADRAAIAELITGYATGRDFFVHRLACGVATLAAAFYPKPVILRFSDFKTNEYGCAWVRTALTPQPSWHYGTSRCSAKP